MTIDLSSTYAGLRIKNPLIAGSGPPTHTPEACLRAAQAGFAGVVLKTHPSKEVPRTIQGTVGRPFYVLTDWRGIERWRPIPPKKADLGNDRKRREKKPSHALTLTGGTTLSYFLEDGYVEHANRTKQLVGEEVLVIASIVAFNKEGWKHQCSLINKTKVDAVELNMGCSHATPGGEDPDFIPGVPIGTVPPLIEKFTKWATECLNIPAIVKIPPQQRSPLMSAQAAVKGGASGVTFTDSGFGPSLRVDIESATPGWDPKYPCFTSSWGPWAQTFVCGNVANFHINRIGVDISASGGVDEFQDVIRFIMAGATSVQSCRAIMINGWEIVGQWLKDITTWMEKKKYRSINDMKGIVADKVVTDRSKLPIYVPQIMGGPPLEEHMVVDERKCIACKWCVDACLHLACTMSEDNKPSFDHEKCELCGVCEAICPVNALSRAKV